MPMRDVGVVADSDDADEGYAETNNKMRTILSSLHNCFHYRSRSCLKGNIMNAYIAALVNGSTNSASIIGV